MASRYSIFSLLKESFRGHRGWAPAWRDPEPKARLRLHRHRWWRPRTGHGLLPGEEPRCPQRRRARERLHRRRQRRPQHDHRPVELPDAGQHPLLRAFAQAVGRPRAGPQLQRDDQPARRAEPVPQRFAARRLRSPRQLDAPARRRRRNAESRAGAQAAAAGRLRQRALPDHGRPDAATRRHGASRRRRLGFRACRRQPRRRHHPELRSDRHPPGRQRRHGRRDHARLHCQPPHRHGLRRQHEPRGARWPACACRSRATCCRRSSRKASSRSCRA